MDSLDKNNFILERPKIKKLYSVNVAGNEIDVPAVYGKVSATMSFFPASYKQTMKIIGDRRVFPVSILPGIGVLAVTVFDYTEGPVGPYREIAISIPSTIDKKIPLLPLFFDSIFSNFGFYTLLLVMNTPLGAQHSTDVFGYPTFHENVTIDIEEHGPLVKVNAYGNGGTIFSMEMDVFHDYHPLQNKKYNTFFSKNSDLKKVEMTVNAFIAERNFHATRNKYTFGSHEIAEKYFKKLLLSDKPIKHIHYRSATEVLSQPFKI